MRIDNSVQKKKKLWSFEILAQHNRKRWLCKRPGRREKLRVREWGHILYACGTCLLTGKPVQRADRQKIDEKRWLVTAYSLTCCSFPGERTGGTGWSRHSAAMTRLSGRCVWGRKAECRLSRGHLPALPHHRYSDIVEKKKKKSRCCMLINTAVWHNLPTVVIESFFSSSSTVLTLRFEIQ